MRNIIAYMILNRTVDVLVNNPETRGKIFGRFRRKRDADQSQQALLVQSTVEPVLSQFSGFINSSLSPLDIEILDGGSIDSPTPVNNILNDIELLE